VVYFHGVVFVGWLCLLTAQVLFIRSRRVDLHRELGMAGTALYGGMVVPGIVTSVVVDHELFATKFVGDGYWGNWAQLYLSDLLLVQ